MKVSVFALLAFSLASVCLGAQATTKVGGTSTTKVGGAATTKVSGVVSATTPAFGAEVTRTSPAFSGTITQDFVLTGNISVGQRSTIIIGHDNTNALVSLADDAGNVYAVNGTGTSTGPGVQVDIGSAPVTSALSSGQKITATFTNTNASWRGAVILAAANTTAFDTTGNQSSATDTPSVTVTTSATNVSIGAIVSPSTGVTVLTPDGTQSGAGYNYNDGIIFIIYKNAPSGSVTIGAMLSSLVHTGTVVVSYK